MSESPLEVLIPSATIQQRTAEIGVQIGRDYPENEPLLLAGVLKGAWVFLADLARAIPRPVTIDFLQTFSYGEGKTSSGEAKLVRDLDTSIEGIHVILVEDIVDTGITLDYLMRILNERQPRSLAIASFLDKPARRRRPVDIRYRGFEVPDRFVVGYGLDYAGSYRNLPDLCAIPEEEAGH
ncbi:MAG: hypoxanthine phosphoribosyltransferase [Bryobacterales bacterium]|nr:hypoxanthine phosphoribosyltransferase [Bryobacterales bacterium]